jgi:ethanolamine ammonia-lyase large subunit
MYGHTVGSVRYTFADLRALLAKATPARSGAAGVTYIMGVPGADDVMLGYQSSRSTTRSTFASCWGCGPRRNSRSGSSRW